MNISTILILSMISLASCRVAKQGIDADEALKMIMPVYQQLLGEAVF
jgi:hypothetical protein